MSIERVRKRPPPPPKLTVTEEVLTTLKNGGLPIQKKYFPPRVFLRVPASDTDFLAKLNDYTNKETYALLVRPRGATGNRPDTPRDKATWFAFQQTRGGEIDG